MSDIVFCFSILFCHSEFIKIRGEEGGRINFATPANAIYNDPFLPRPFREILHWKSWRILFAKFV